MLSDTTSRQVDALRDLLARGALHGLPGITVGDTVTAAAEVVVRVFLSEVDHLGRADAASPAQRALVEEHIQRVHHAIAAAMAS